MDVITENVIVNTNFYIFWYFCLHLLGIPGYRTHGTTSLKEEHSFPCGNQRIRSWVYPSVVAKISSLLSAMQLQKGYTIKLDIFTTDSPEHLLSTVFTMT